MSEIIKYFQLGYLILKTKLMQIIFYINKQGRLNNCIPPNDYKKKFQCFVYWDETTHNFQITNKFFEIWFALLTSPGSPKSFLEIHFTGLPKRIFKFSYQLALPKKVFEIQFTGLTNSTPLSNHQIEF